MPQQQLWQEQENANQQAILQALQQAQQEQTNGRQEEINFLLKEKNGT